ncbi:MAG: biosynthetic-type acetolactate synthase large subunit [SAR324 cluster bacterium]|nr:biosynthetic-type acetolactate synthase large subunit [SAR324 cluster bacterium]
MDLGAQQELTGAEALVKILEEKGVEVLFGYPGGANLPIFDALIGSKVQPVLSRHEQGSIHMAEGYARVKHAPGVVLATSGPGATNLVTGLADALLDSIPIVALTGQIPRENIGTDAFQEVDCFNITMPVTKHNELIRNNSELVLALETAFYVANTGRKGPCLIDFPVDLLAAKFPFDFDERPNLPGYKPTTKGNIGQIKKAIKAIKNAERPIVLIGGGIVLSRAIPELLEFVRKSQLPVVRTLLGTGVIPVDDPLYIGMIGTHGNQLANDIVQKEADLIVAIGTKLGNRSTVAKGMFAQNAKLIHLDIDPAEIGKIQKVDIPIVGDVKETLQIINERIDEKPIREDVVAWKKGKKIEHMLPTSDNAEVLEVVLKALSQMDQKLHVTTDVGRHQMWANHYCTNPKHLPLITSAGLGTMGFGLPAAIGAWFADRGTTVVNVSGDGSFMMNMQEFLVAVEHQIPIVVMIINDQRLSMIRELQNMKYGERHTVHDLGKSMDYIKFAESMGGTGYEVHHQEMIFPIINKAIASRKPCIIDFDIAKIANSAHLKALGS